MLGDAAPVVPVARPLKRSASTASLPTPPRTRRRRKVKVGSHVSDESDSDVGRIASSDEEDVLQSGKSVIRGRKAGKEVGRGGSDDEEDEFWKGTASSKTLSTASPTRKQSGQLDRSPSSSPIPFLDRRKQASMTLGAAPVSPPPSRRVTRTVVAKDAYKRAESLVLPTITDSPEAAIPVSPSPPVTPERKKKAKAPVKKLGGPLLADSPDNPFIDRDDDSDVEATKGEDNTSSPEPEPRTPHEERPTLAYVFRGVKAQLKNPLYDHVNKRPLPIDPDSLLPPEHPDYSGDLTCPPKLLFPQAHRKRPAQKRAKRAEPATRYVDSSDDEDSGGLRGRMDLPAGMAAVEAPVPPLAAGLRRSPRRRGGRGFAVAGGRS